MLEAGTGVGLYLRTPGLGGAVPDKVQVSFRSVLHFDSATRHGDSEFAKSSYEGEPLCQGWIGD